MIQDMENTDDHLRLLQVSPNVLIPYPDTTGLSYDNLPFGFPASKFEANLFRTAHLSVQRING